MTPGPWKIKPALTRDQQIISWDVGPERIIPGIEDHPAIKIVAIVKDEESDAHLISAAPELYEALKDLLDRSTAAVRYRMTAEQSAFATLLAAKWEKIAAALAKAEGRTP